MTALLIEGTELYEAVAHHIRVGRKARTHLLHGVTRDLIPVLPVTIDHLQPTAILMRHSRRHLEILLRGAVPLLIVLRTDLDIETVGVKSEPGELVHHHTAIDTA